ncbi:MAG: heparinase II/III family protein, partial [Bacteroidota bacterium]
LEFDSRGNHLFENLKALILGGIFFGTGNKGAVFFRVGEKFLPEQLSEQILSDGGHFERSPMYHCIVLEGLLTLLVGYRSQGLQPPPDFESIIKRMLEFLQAMLLPDGEYPLFNDSANEIALPPQVLIDWGKTVLGWEFKTPVKTEQFVASGYARLESGAGDVLIMDYGEPCPPFLPAHSHADSLSFEWCLADGNRVFTDPGIFEYTAGSWRDYFRSTKAHNTLCLDNQNSTEVWSSFRASRKAKIMAAGLQKTENWTHVFAQHNGYSFLPGKPVHRRDLYLLKEGILLVIDTVTGSGKHFIETNLNLHPSWELTKNTGQSVSLHNNNHQLQLDFLNPGELIIAKGELEPKSGWYSPQFNLKVPSLQITWRIETKIPYLNGFICYPSNSGLSYYHKDDRIYLNSGTGNYIFDLIY